jgi:hypothetical protein
MARKNKDKNVTEDLEHNQFSKAVDNLKKIYKEKNITFRRTLFI